MYCTYCGAKNQEGSRYCESCGKPLDDDAQTHAGIPHSQVVNLSRKHEPNRILAEGFFVAKWVVSIFLGFVAWMAASGLLLAIVGIIFYLSLGGGKSIQQFTMNSMFGILTGQINLRSTAVAFVIATTLVMLVEFVLFGIAIGLAEWLPIRNRIGQAHWIRQTLIGFVMGVLLLIPFNNILSATGNEAAKALIISVAIGGCIGIFQWLILRKYFRNSYWWIVGNIVSLFLAFLVSFIIGKAEEGFGAFLAMFLFAVLTGGTISWLSSGKPSRLQA